MQIYRDSLHSQLSPTDLAHYVCRDGYVVFISTRIRQRTLAKEVRKLLDEEGISIVEGETNSPNSCMCVVDHERLNLSDLLDKAAQFDYEQYDKNP